MSGRNSHRNGDSNSALTQSGKANSWIRTLAIILAVLFFLTTVTFVSLFLVFYLKYNNSGVVPLQTGDPIQLDAPTQSEVIRVTTTVTACNTPECVLTAGKIASSMNRAADPCQDFSEFACGGFNKLTILPENKTRADISIAVQNRTRQVLRGILEEKITPGEPKYLSNMKRLYKSCMNVAQMEATGITPYLSESTFAWDWPTLNQNWNEYTFNLNDVIARYAAIYILPLFRFTVDLNLTDSTRWSLMLDEPVLGLHDDYINLPRNHTIFMAYETSLVNIAVALGASRMVAVRDAKDVVDLEVALSKIKVTKEVKNDRKKLYNPVTLRTLSTMYPLIDIPRALRAAYNTANMSLSDHDLLINLYPTYIGNITEVLGKVPKRTVQNLFGFKFAVSRISGLTKSLRNSKWVLDMFSGGKQEESSRWEDCLAVTSEAFKIGLGKQYVLRTFTEDSKIYVKEMVSNIADELKQMIKESTWIAQATKEEAEKKLAATNWKIGYPDENFLDDDLDKEYANHVMVEDNYYANLLLKHKLSNIKSLKIFRSPVDKTEWRDPLYKVNAAHFEFLNHVEVPVGIMQFPYFSRTFPEAMNYGALGTLIGHEINHGYDNEGRMHDPTGTLRDWWQRSDHETFARKAHCFTDQYNGFFVPEINRTLNGVVSLSENMADTDGLKMSYRAYKKLAPNLWRVQMLTGLNLTQDQLFFLGFSQFLCEKNDISIWQPLATKSSHAPGRYRILGTLQNSEGFAKAYNCPVGSYMNPVKKCSIW